MSPERSGFDEPTAPMPSAEAGPPSGTKTPRAPESGERSLDGWLPSRPVSTPAGRAAPADPLSIEPGGRIGEFVVERTLGKGGFGVVYLARQISLDRHVALKVVAGEGGAADGEGRSLARLEHDHIVQVYAEAFDPVLRVRLLCMQYVAGTTLSTLARELNKFRPGRWTGPDLLAVLDNLGLPPVLFDPQAMRDRDRLAAADHVEAVCRIGEQIARALEHAHERGVLHRDVKPANVLVSRYGRPLLADFNLATRDADDTAAFGGTLAYMAPEHLDAFNPECNTPHEAVDAGSDLYSLCVVLWELSSGDRPFPSPGGTIERDELPGALRKLAAQRRGTPPQNPPLDRRLRRALARGLSPEPTDRYASAGHLAETLAGLREQRVAVRAFPKADAVARWAWDHPVRSLLLAGVLPQFVGSFLQISYNELRITLTPAQEALFWNVLVPAYNVTMYPACLTWLGLRVLRVTRVWRSLRRGDPISDEEIDRARVRALELPRDTVIAACVGWFPGAVVFPAALHFAAERVPPKEWGHFAVSFALAGLIALTYSFFLGTGVVVRTMYVRFWTDPRNFRERAAQELADVPDWLRTFSVLAGIIPLVGAVLLVLTATDGGEMAFRALTALLIGAGIAGFMFVGRLSRRYLQVIDACTGGPARAAGRSRRPASPTNRAESDTSFSPGRSADPPTL